MNKNTLHNSRENRIKNLFKAPEWNLQRFGSGLLYLFLVCIVFAGSVISFSTTAESKRSLPISFGVEQTVNVFPTEVVTDDWAGIEHVLVQDLTDDSLYQEFTARNSAYIAQEEINLPQSSTTTSDQSTTNEYSKASSSIEAFDTLESSPDTATNEEEFTEAKESEEEVDEIVEPEPVGSVSYMRHNVWGVFSRAQDLFPLTQLSTFATTAPTDAFDEPSTEDSERVILEDQAPNPTDVPLVEEIKSDAIESFESEEMEEAVNNLETNTVDKVTTTEESIESTTLDATQEIHEIVLSDFATAPLEPGQFVEGMQLRVSFAAQLERNVETLPAIEVVMRTPSSSSVVGSILIDGEISNAINGGYFLFALPTELQLVDLETAEIIIRYIGTADEVDGLFLDAAWFELDTRIISAEDLKARGKAEKLTHLATPEITTLISDKTNFSREENPLFNLRYNAQRNPLVRGLRSFAGSDLVSVENAILTHKSIGRISAEPVITTTRDGLITLEFQSADTKNFRPGTYQIELTLSEGGVEFTDTFDFQWGILTINPNKSEYETGELVDISIGALTPNGHTICKANLDLYITDPNDAIERVVVEESGLCDGNNVIDVPDFSAQTTALIPGEYELYLERLDDEGNVLGFTTDTFLVTIDQQLSIERLGPTRIYPPAPYPMELTVTAESGFDGVLTERVPASFSISDTTAEVEIDGDEKVLTWNLAIPSGGSRTVSYQFDAPDLSPYLFNLGPANLQETSHSVVPVGSTSSVQVGGRLFTEHRQWQIASDAVGNMILFWDDGASIPTDWTCLSCGSGTYYQRFVMGSSTYNTTGGAATHTHTAAGSVLATSETGGESGTGDNSPISHGHSYTPVINAVSNLPTYRQLRVIQYTAAAGEPTTIPQGAIAIFDVASSSLPTSWNRYAVQDGYYVYGENTPGTTGGSNTHTHTISGTTGAGTGAGTRSRGGTNNGALDTHTHTVSGSTGSVNNEPQYIEVLLAQAAADVSPANGIIAMWTEDVDDGWIDVSSDPSDPFSNRFIKPATSYGTTGGVNSHSHADVTGLTTSAPSAVNNTVDGTSGASDTHTHQVNVTSFSTDSHLPPYLTAVFGKRQGTNPVYSQISSRWYANATGITPSEPWPNDAGVLDLVEREPITSTSSPVKNGEVVRLRLNVGIDNATSTAGSGFKLQFAEADVCSAATAWFDIGGSASTSLWRGYNNTPADGATLPSTLLASSTVEETYEEDGTTASTPNDIPVGDFGEWDFALEHNGANPGVNYCFRLVESSGSSFSSYEHYPQLYTNEAPTAPILDKLFDNEKTPSTTPWFYFAAADAEGEKVHYEIQVDNDYDFSSPVIERDTIDDSAQFENQVLISDKAPFRQGELIEFVPVTTLSNGTTYFWRVRAQDPDGSNEWGDWSTIYSFTIDTSLAASAWFQTLTEQFDTNTLDGIDTSSNQADVTAGSSTATMYSDDVVFSEGEQGTAWDSLTFNETDGSNVLEYQIEYYDGSAWALIPDANLAGNSAGFGTSPVSLLNLDVDTYNTIRVVANFTANTGSPSLQDWTINWGYRVETPTISKLFANEQVGTTTPSFTFTTTDPQGDSLTYQISWSTTPDFTSSTTRTSDTPGGFSNLSNQADTDPFDSGATIQYTIQPADALTGTTTYWWRVRAKDTTGDDAYSFWTDVRSFTVIPGTDVSTWFQTTEEQFDTDILSGTIALANDVVTVATTATEAMIVYGEGTETEPRYRQWNGSSLTSEGTLQSVSAPLKWAVVKAAPSREEYVAATLGTDADINVQVFAMGEWSDLLELTTGVSNISARGFDVTYESLSGDAMVAFCDGDADPSYAIWNGTSWQTSATSTINVSETTNCEWIQLASDPVSDEIIVLMRGSDGNPYEAQVWNGTSWGNATTFGSVTETGHEGMAVEYEESGGQALIVTSDGNPNRFRWNSWNGTTWGTAATVALNGDLEWADLVRDIGTDEMALCHNEDSNGIGVTRWSGSAWANDPALETASDKTEAGFACIYEDTAGRDNYIMLTYADAAATQYRTHNTTSWAAEAQVNSIVNTPTMELARTGSALILGTFFDSTNDTLRFSTWDGSSWSTTQDLETNASVDAATYGRPYSMAPRNAGTAGTTIVSPGIDFNDGLGPYWKEFSWSDTQPGSSQILYRLQYQTATGSWAFIPNTDLPDNDAGTTTGPFDLSGLNTNTYNVLRPYAELTCEDADTCPSIQDWKIEWAGGITISGTAYQYDEAASTTSGTVAVAVNGTLQTGKTGTINNGAWSIDNVTTFAGDIVTVFVTGAADANEAVGVARYDGQGDMDGVVLYERHLTLGSNDATTTPFTNAEIGQYDFDNNEDVFIDLVGSTTLNMCGGGACTDAALYVGSNTYYSPTGNLITHDFENNGVFTAGTNVIEVNGSWDNNATTTMTGSTVVFAATSTTETVDSTGQQTIFNNVIFGTTTGNGTWTLANALDVNGDLTVARGTLARNITAITVAGDLVTAATGFWTGLGTTTFDGSGTVNWSDQNATLQNVGKVVVDGSSKNLVLASNVAAESITIGANDTLDVSINHYDIYVYGSWNNQNNFLARNGEVFFVATSSGQTITTAGDAFYDLTFAGVAGGWSFTENTLLVNNDFVVSTGTVTLPSATTTIAGSFDATGGTFQNNNGVLYFTSNGSESITFDGVGFNNVARNLTFNGAGTWNITDTNATTTNDVIIQQGTVTFPTGNLSIGGSLETNGGSFISGTGTVTFYSVASETIATDGSAFNNLIFDGSGDWAFTDTNASVAGDLTILQGTAVLPSGTLTIGGSYDNNATVTAGSGTVLFDSSDTGETIDLGASTLNNVLIENDAGGWTILTSATTTGSFTLASSSSFTLQNGESLSVAGVFTNRVGGASTTWTGTVLSLESGDYSINSKTNNGDLYDTLRIAAGTHIAMWNSIASTYVIDPTGSLYSQDHNAADGDLYIFGAYENNGGTEYWSYDTDFDGTDLTGGSERQVDVRFANGASASLDTSNFELLGASTASTTIANQSTGTYTVTISGGTTTAQYYEFDDLGGSGVSFIDSAIVNTLRDGSYTVTVGGGSALTLSSTTIDANPAKQIFNVTFATSSAIAATNVTQTDGTAGSYWWFRAGSGNLYGESFDNDDGDPGSVRFDDSSLVLDISGVLYTNDETTKQSAPVCDGATTILRLAVEGGGTYDTSCDGSGQFTFNNVVIVGDPVIAAYVNAGSSTLHGMTVSKTPTGDINDFDIFRNRVTVRHEDTDPITISDMAVFGYGFDTDHKYFAATGTTDTLEVFATNELHVASTSTFAPDGDITLYANASANDYDGTLHLAQDSTFIGSGTSTYTVGGRIELESGATFTPANTSVIMNATTTGKSITAPSTVTFHELDFTGVGGSWNVGADITVSTDMTIATGTVTGTGDITIPNGSLTGDGVLSMGGGTTTLGSTNNLGGPQAWTFHNLQLGDGLVSGTTTPLFTSTTTIGGTLAIAAAHFLDAGNTSWDLAGAGTVFVENGTFLEDTSTIRYSGNGSNVLSTQYYNLDINAGAGSPTYTVTGLGIIVDGDLTIGGDAVTIFDLNTNDPAFDLNGNLTIRNNGTLSTSNSADFMIAGSYDNNGTLIHNNGTLTFDGTGAIDIAAGVSDFGNVDILATGNITLSESATSSANFRLLTANSFTLTSSESLAVGAEFLNDIGGGATTWTNTTLRLFGGSDYSINTSTTSDAYGTLIVDANTQIRVWNSVAQSYVIDSSGSLYSQDHNNIAGDLYVWGTYSKTNASDYWSYARDFDGTNLTGGSERKVDVYIATSSSVSITGGFLDVTGATSASTTVQSMGVSDYSLTIGGSASTSWRYYELRDQSLNGLTFTGSANVDTIANGDIEVSQTGGSGLTIGGTVITANPAQNYTSNRFALNGVVSGFNVTATGTSVSSWRFVNHYGDIDGEANDIDPDGDPGYVAWDDSAAQITISGRVYQDDASTVSTACTAGDEIRLVVAGISSATTTCDSGTGVYSFSNIAYGPTDSLIVYINGSSVVGASVTKEPISNISGFDIYENHVIVRHENTDPITIADMAVYDSSDDGDIPFTAVNAGTDTLTLPADTKLIVWNAKSFEPAGNVTTSNAGTETYDGDIELFASAEWSGQGTELLTVGGSLALGTSATFVSSNGTTTFTTDTTGKIIDVNNSNFYNLAITGTGDLTITDSGLTVNANYTQSNGSVTFPTGTSTFAGSFTNTGGSFTANNGAARFVGASTHTVTLGGSDLHLAEFAGGSYAFGDTEATTTDSVRILSGSLTLPSGSLVIGGDFVNLGGSITHNTSDVLLTATSTATVLASSSDLYSVTFAGGASYSMVDTDLTLLDSLTILDGAVTLPSGTIAIGGSFDASGGTFINSSSTILFNSADGGEVIDSGVSQFYNVQIGAPTGGYTLTSDATTTNNFTLASANSFTAQSGVTLKVEGVFTNSVGGNNTTWSGSTLALDGSNAYSINAKTDSGDQYETLVIGANSDLRVWNSAATTTIVDPSSSLYSQDHASNNGDLYIFGDFRISTTTEYWSYATDFDGTSLSGSERAVIVAHAANATTSVDGGTLNIAGVSGNQTTVTNQGSGTYAMNVSAGKFFAQYYAYRNLNTTGLSLSGTPVISSLSYGDYELAVNGGTLITIASTTLNANASLVIAGNRFATTTAITGNNVTLTGTTPAVWTYTSHTGNLDGEAFDVDGATACGSVRWSDSSCLLTQQTSYRWRNDDGGLEVPAAEWYNASWGARKRVRVTNDDTQPYTNAAVQLFVAYDSDMQADFDDLRFTDEGGTSTIDFWIGSTTNSVLAEVWVEVPSLPAEDTATLFMYYNNPSANSSSSLSNTFIAGDDFEDGNISEYSVDTAEFNVDASFAFDGVYGLEPDDILGRSANGGIIRTDDSFNDNDVTIRYKQYVDTAGTQDEICTLFAVQAAHQNYGVCVELPGTDHIAIVEDVTDNEDSGTTLSSVNYSFTTGWYTFEVDWDGDDNSIFVQLFDDTDTLVATTSATDSTYTDGGYGFTYWFNRGGWDGFTVRPTLVTEPTVLFGAEQGDGGASWKTSEKTAGVYDVGDVARLRLAIENSGLAITNQQFRLEYAALGAAPSCEAVNAANYSTVPTQAGCGSSPVCMVGSTNVTNGASTVDLLTDVVGTFTAGEAREDPSNTTGNLNVGQDQYTELEYAVTPTINVTDQNLCFRVTNAGTDYDTYLSVARMTLRFDPVLGTIVFNNGANISLLPGTTTRVYATTTVSDLNGVADLAYATSTFYRGGVGAACTADNNNCYISAAPLCSFTNCSGNQCDVECYADIFFHADPTDDGVYDGEEWFAFIEVEDMGGGYDFDTSAGRELDTLRAIDIEGAIDYGTLAVNADTGSINASTTIENQGNVEADIEISGTDLTDGASSAIPAEEQLYATSTFTYSSCGAECQALSSTTPTQLDIDLSKPTTDSPPVADSVYWGIFVPFGVNSTVHQGTNVFTPVSP